MGRPIKKSFFGNLISPYQNHAVRGKTGVGGEGFATLSLLNGGSTTYYSTTTAVTWLASAPQVAGGVPASGTATVSAAGKITALTISDAGSGYTSTASVTVAFSPATTGTAATYGVSLTTTRPNALSFYSYLSTGTTAVNAGDILKQEGSRRYLVQNSEGTGICNLSATGTNISPGQMFMIATDYNGSTYLVKKLTARKAVVVQSTQSTAFLVGDGVSTGWTLGAATGTVVSITHTV
jgi:hypothetical protein